MDEMNISKFFSAIIADHILVLLFENKGFDSESLLRALTKLVALSQKISYERPLFPIIRLSDTKNASIVKSEATSMRTAFVAKHTNMIRR